MNSYKMLTGESFQDTMKKFQSENISHFAKVNIGQQEFDFLLLDKSVFGTTANSYIFVNAEKHQVYAPSTMEDEEVIQSYMYILLLKNFESYENKKVEDFFKDESIFSKVQEMRLGLVISPLPKDKPIVYMDDYRIIESYPNLKFTSYVLDYKKLETQFGMKFEARHIGYFSNIKNVKESFREFKTPVGTMDELQKDGIYIDTIQYNSMLDSIQSKEDILLTGPTGAGKSTILKYVLQKSNADYELIQCNEQKTYESLFGSLTVDNNQLIPSLGKIAIAYRDGKTLWLEEFTKLNADNFAALLSMMTDDVLTLEIDKKQENGEFVKSITIPRHPNFHIIATANEEKRYNVNQLTPQIKRRFHTIVPINYLPENQEKQLITQRLENKNLEHSEEVVHMIVTSANNLRQKKLVVSTATLAIWAEKAVKYGIIDAAVCHFVPQVVFNKTDLETVNNVLSANIVNYKKVDIAI